MADSLDLTQETEAKRHQVTFPSGNSYLLRSTSELTLAELRELSKIDAEGDLDAVIDVMRRLFVDAPFEEIQQLTTTHLRRILDFFTTIAREESEQMGGGKQSRSSNTSTAAKSKAG